MIEYANKKGKETSLLVFGLIGMAIFLLNFVALHTMSPDISTVSLVLYTTILVSLYKIYPAFFIITLPILVFRATEFVSFFVIEHGAYMRETSVEGVASGGSARYLFLTTIFLLGAKFTFRDTIIAPTSKLTLDADKLQKTVIILFCTTMALIFINLIRLGIINGFPLIIQAERFAYWSQISDPLFKIFTNYHTTISLISGALISYTRAKVLGILILLLHLVFMLLFGMKQTAFSLSLVAATIPILFAAYQSGKMPSMKKFVLLGGVFMGFSVVTALLSYGREIDVILAQFIQRIALQGQLWHLADQSAIHGYLSNFSHDSFNQETSDWFSFNFRPAFEVGYEYGLYKVMHKYSHPDILFYYTRDKIGFIFALLPAWLISYGYFTLTILVFLSGSVWGLWGRLLLLSFKTKSLMALPILGQIYAMQTAAHIDGMSYRIFGLQIWVYLALSYMIIISFRQLGNKSYAK